MKIPNACIIFLLLSLSSCVGPRNNPLLEADSDSDDLFVTIEWSGMQTRMRYSAAFASQSRTTFLESWLQQHKWAGPYAQGSIISDFEARRLRRLLVAERFRPFRSVGEPNGLIQQYVIRMYSSNEFG